MFLNGRLVSTKTPFWAGGSGTTRYHRRWGYDVYAWWADCLRTRLSIRRPSSFPPSEDFCIAVWVSIAAGVFGNSVRREVMASLFARRGGPSFRQCGGQTHHWSEHSKVRMAIGRFFVFPTAMQISQLSAPEALQESDVVKIGPPAGSNPQWEEA